MFLKLTELENVYIGKVGKFPEKVLLKCYLKNSIKNLFANFARGSIVKLNIYEKPWDKTSKCNSKMNLGTKLFVLCATIKIESFIPYCIEKICYESLYHRHGKLKIFLAVFFAFLIRALSCDVTQVHNY